MNYNFYQKYDQQMQGIKNIENIFIDPDTEICT